MKAANRDFTRELNLFNILNSIREAGSISRVEIAEKTGQSRASVTNITALLIERGLIYEDQVESSTSRGRRRIMLMLNPDAAYTVGIKIAAFRLSFAVVDFVGQVKSTLSIPFRVGERSAAMLAAVAEDGILHCLEDARLKLEDLSGCGLAIPGFVDSASGTCYWTPIQNGSSNIRDLLAQRLDMDVYLENDANSFTVASQWFGLGKGIRNFLVVTIEEGIGMGIVVDGKLYQGATGIAAEFGHMVIVPDGEPCRCGKLGCFEAYSADSGILQQARKLLKRRKNGPDQDMLTIEEVTRWAREGDRGLRKIFQQSGEFLARGVAGLIQIFNPERVIITGEGVRAGDLVFDPMHKLLGKYLNREQANSTQILIQEWNDHDWAQGAAGFVLSEIYKSPLNKIQRSG
ncbi:ROK family transcriptional regulator [Crocinitomicaceae bacterium]|nr:ROK family transcriptional regulator [Crocinitomicaceae bacterium]